MSGFLLLFLYGASCWGAAINFPAWVGLFLVRWRDEARKPLAHDTFLLTRTGLTLMSFGVAGLAGLRLSSSLMGNMKLEIPSTIGLLFIGAMALAEPFFLRVDDLHARARGSISYGWWIYWFGIAWWVLAVFVLSMSL